MQIIPPIAILLMYLLVPGAVIIACQKLPALDKIGVVVVSFALGILLATLGVLPQFDGLAALQENVVSISVAIALSLLVFSMDIVAALKFSGETLKSLVLALISVILVSMVAAIIFAPHLPFMWQIAGMSVGAYTGGGPNMAAIKTAIDADMGAFTDMLTYDILLSSLYVLFVITIAKPIFGRFLKPFKEPENLHNHSGFDHLADETANSYRSLARLALLPKTALALMLAVVILAVSVGISQLASEAMASAVIIISITTLGVLASFIRPVRNLPNSYPLGMYLILIFCFASGTMIDPSIFHEIKWALFGYISTILIGSLILQAILCKLFKIDVDTFLISSSAAIMSVPFIPVIAGALKNKYVLVPGFAAAIIGYILGNYLGITVALTLKSLLAA